MDGDEMIDFIVGIEEDGEPARMVFHDDLFHLLREIRSSQNSRFRRFDKLCLFHDAEHYLSDFGNGQFGDGFEFRMDILLLVEELVEVGIRNSVVQGVESLSHVLTDEIKDKRVGFADGKQHDLSSRSHVAIDKQGALLLVECVYALLHQGEYTLVGGETVLLHQIFSECQFFCSFPVPIAISQGFSHGMHLIQHGRTRSKREVVGHIFFCHIECYIYNGIA